MIALFKPNVNVEETLRGVRAVLESGQLAQGPVEAVLEAALERIIEAPLVLTSSCTAALDLAAYLAPVTPNSIVLTTAQTCAATNSVLVHRGAVLAWIDVDRLTGNITPTTLDQWFEDNPGAALHRRVSALVTVDWGGRPCDYDGLRAVLERRLDRPIPIIEDAAHALLAQYKQQPITRVGGDLVAYSFQAIKHLTTGDGGALVCRDAMLLERARKLKWFGLDRSAPGPRFMQDIAEAGFKYHMNDIAAAIGLANLTDLGATVDTHRHNARRLWEPLLSARKIEVAPFDYGSSYWFFGLLVDDRESLRAALADTGIESGEVHRRNDIMTAFKKRSLIGHTTLNGLDEFSRRQLNLPCGPWMTPEALALATRTIHKWASA